MGNPTNQPLPFALRFDVGGQSMIDTKVVAAGDVDGAELDSPWNVGPFTISVAIAGGEVLDSATYTPGDCSDTPPTTTTEPTEPGLDQPSATAAVWCEADQVHTTITLVNPTSALVNFETTVDYHDGYPLQGTYAVRAGETELLEESVPADRTAPHTISIGYAGNEIASVTYTPDECPSAPFTTVPSETPADPTVPTTTPDDGGSDETAPSPTATTLVAGDSGTNPTTTNTPPTSGQLPMTGSTSTPIVVIAAAALAGGAGLRLIARRRS